MLNSADTAFLLTSDSNVCGVGYLDSSYYPFAMATHKCARYDSNDKTHIYKTFIPLHINRGYYTFAHELGHVFGAAHDRDASSNAPYSYGYGKKFLKGATDNTGYRTLMAYVYFIFCEQAFHPHYIRTIYLTSLLCLP
jgi:hypothetical protein